MRPDLRHLRASRTGEEGRISRRGCVSPDLREGEGRSHRGKGAVRRKTEGRRKELWVGPVGRARVRVDGWWKAFICV